MPHRVIEIWTSRKGGFDVFVWKHWMEEPHKGKHFKTMDEALKYIEEVLKEFAAEKLPWEAE